MRSQGCGLFRFCPAAAFRLLVLGFTVCVQNLKSGCAGRHMYARENRSICTTFAKRSLKSDFFLHFLYNYVI